MSDQATPAEEAAAGLPGPAAPLWPTWAARPPEAIWAPRSVWEPLHPPRNGFGASAQVLGIVSLVFFCGGGPSLLIFPIGVLATGFFWWPVAVVCGVLGVVQGGRGLSLHSKGQATNRSAARTGVICGSIALIGVVAAVLLFLALAAGQSFLD